MAYDVVSFGETMLRLSPPAGIRTEDAHAFNTYVGGTESNVLACLARLGLRCAWASALPSNPLGRRVNIELRGHGVDTSRVVWSDNARLGVFWAEEAPQPIGIQLHYDRAQSAFALVDPAALDLSFIDGARLLHLTGITPALGDGPSTVLNNLLRLAHESGVPVSFDVNYRAKLWSPSDAASRLDEPCRAASILFCTRDDAATLWGYTGDPETVLRKIKNRFGTENERTTVLTLGHEGTAQLRADEYSAAPAYPSDGTSRFGSGDAFAAGYLYAHLGGPVYEAARAVISISPLHVGNACAALKRCIQGDIALIGPDDVARVLDRDSGARFRFR